MTECSNCKKTFKNVALHYNKMHSEYFLKIVLDNNKTKIMSLDIWVDNYDGTTDSSCEVLGSSSDDENWLVSINNKLTHIVIDNKTHTPIMWIYWTKSSTSTPVIDSKKIKYRVKTEQENIDDPEW